MLKTNCSWLSRVRLFWMEDDFYQHRCPHRGWWKKLSYKNEAHVNGVILYTRGEIKCVYMSVYIYTYAYVHIIHVYIFNDSYWRRMSHVIFESQYTRRIWDSLHMFVSMYCVRLFAVIQPVAKARFTKNSGGCLVIIVICPHSRSNSGNWRFAGKLCC